MIPEFEWIKEYRCRSRLQWGTGVYEGQSDSDCWRGEYAQGLSEGTADSKKGARKSIKKLSGNCMLCGKTEDKNKMVTLTARAVRGGRAASFSHMCHSCFAKWLTTHNIPVPDLENKRRLKMAKRSCRRTTDENLIHKKAVEMRKKTDEQLVHYVEDRVEKARSEGFNLEKASVPKTGEGAKEFIAFLQLNKIRELEQ